MMGRARDERGATLVLFSLMIVAVFVMTAIVVDLGQSRSDRRVNKASADLASTAGVEFLKDSPRSAVCKAREYLLKNTRSFTSFTTETWVDGNGSTIANPCDPLQPAFKVRCSPLDKTTWVRFTGTANASATRVEIKAPYVLPDPAFPEDAIPAGDNGDPVSQGCDHVAVITTETRKPGFSGVIAAGDRTTRVRSVARLTSDTISEEVAALILLERHDCNVLQTGGSNTRVVAKAFNGKPGIIQIDSRADGACQSQPIINGQANATSGPSIVACSAPSTATYGNVTCAPNTFTTPPKPSIIAVVAKTVGADAGKIARPFANGEYGDTEVVGGKLFTRKQVDKRYRANVATLDQAVHDAICVESGTTCTSTRSKPLGCGPVSGTPATCTDAGGTPWRVFDGPACNSVGASGGVITEQNLFFACDLNVGSAAALSFTSASANVVITGKLTLANTTLHAPNARRFYVGGTDQGNKIGIDIGNGGQLILNGPAVGACPVVAGAGVNVLALGKGTFKAGSGGKLGLCQTFLYVASGYGKVPTVDGTAPCPSTIDTPSPPCGTYSGIIDIGSGAAIDWTAPNQLLTKPKDTDFATFKFEDLAFWTEAATASNGINGGGGASMSGIFFLPNADEFTMAGNSGASISLNAQFIARKLKVTGGAVISLVPDPDNAISVEIFFLGLVR